MYFLVLAIVTSSICRIMNSSKLDCESESKNMAVKSSFKLDAPPAMIIHYNGKICIQKLLTTLSFAFCYQPLSSKDIAEISCLYFS